MPGDWNTRISQGLWTRHAPDKSSSSVLDYSMISGEHLNSVMEMVVDEHGKMGGRLRPQPGDLENPRQV